MVFLNRTLSISFYDAYENLYNGFLLEILVNMKRYIIKSIGDNIF